MQYIALLKRSTRYEILCVTTTTDAVQHSTPPFVHQHIHTNIYILRNIFILLYVCLYMLYLKEA
jgi:hypothetical protein